MIQVDDPHLCLFVDDDVRAKYADPEAAAAFAAAKTNEMVAGLDCGATKLAVHLCRRAGGKARGEHSHDGTISR